MGDCQALGPRTVGFLLPYREVVGRLKHRSQHQGLCTGHPLVSNSGRWHRILLLPHVFEVLKNFGTQNKVFHNLNYSNEKDLLTGSG